MRCLQPCPYSPRQGFYVKQGIRKTEPNPKPLGIVDREHNAYNLVFKNAVRPVGRPRMPCISADALAALGKNVHVVGWNVEMGQLCWLTVWFKSSLSLGVFHLLVQQLP